MNPDKYIPVEKDIVKLTNQLKSLEDLINIEAFSSYGRYAHCYAKNYNGSDGKRSRYLAYRTIRKAFRTLVVIRKKINLDESKDEKIHELLKLAIRLTEFQTLLIL